MSLKAFHILFILASILLAFGFAAWAWVHFAREGQSSLLYYGIGSTSVGLALVGYFTYVLRKLKHESYL